MEHSKLYRKSVLGEGSLEQTVDGDREQLREVGPGVEGGGISGGGGPEEKIHLPSSV